MRINRAHTQTLLHYIDRGGLLPWVLRPALKQHFSVDGEIDSIKLAVYSAVGEPASYFSFIWEKARGNDWLLRL